MTACPSCGAAVSDGDDRCPLCGTSLTTDAPDAETLNAEADAGAIRPADDPLDTSVAEASVCPECGHANPAGAAFCNACGTRLGADVRPPRASAPAAPAPAALVDGPPAVAPAQAAGRRALLVAGVAVAAVVALYVATAASGGSASRLRDRPDAQATGTTDAAVAAAAVPDGPAPPLADSLQRAADALEAQNTASGWYEAGRYYLTAGFDAQQTGNAQGVLWIRRAIADFEKSLAIADDPDVRFALAEASQFDPANPMRPVTELRTLLAAHPDHVGGNFLLGERRMMIGRLDSARVSFERVVALAPSDDPLRARASEMLAQLAQAGAPTRGVPDGASAPPPAGVPAR